MSWPSNDWASRRRGGVINVHTISGTASAGAQNQVTLVGVAGQMMYLRRAVITSGAVAAVVSGTVQISNVATDDSNPLNFIFTETVSAGGWLDLNFTADEVLQASALGGSIVVTLPAIGGGASSAISLVGWST